MAKGASRDQGTVRGAFPGAFPGMTSPETWSPASASEANEDEGIFRRMVMFQYHNECQDEVRSYDPLRRRTRRGDDATSSASCLQTHERSISMRPRDERSCPQDRTGQIRLTTDATLAMSRIKDQAAPEDPGPSKAIIDDSPQ